MIRSTFTFLTIMTVLACSPSGSMTEKEKGTVIAEVRETLDNYYSDIKKSGLTAEFKYLDSTADFFWVPPGYSSPISYDSVAKVIGQNATLYKTIDNTYDTLRIVPLSKELASFTGRLDSKMTDSKYTTTTIHLVETGVMIRRKDGWKLYNGQTAVISPK